MQIAIRCALVLAGALAVGCATNEPKSYVRADLHPRLGHVKLSKGQYEVAIREYRRALALHAKDVEARFGLAEAYRLKGLYPEAAEELETALRIDPLHQEARLNLSVVYLQMERWQDAIVQTQILLDDPTFPRPARALVNQGWAHYNSGDIERARLAFADALGADRNTYQAALNLGIVLYDTGELVESIRYFERVREIVESRGLPNMDPALAEARFRMARAHVKLQQVDKAIEHLQRGSELGGGGEWGVKSREYLLVLQ